MDGVRSVAGLGQNPVPKAMGVAFKNSPKKYAQHQLFALLVLKSFLKANYRGVAHHLEETSSSRW